MPITLYDISIPPFLRGFANMGAHLDKARAFADANGIAHADLIGARLIADMHPLSAQVQRASDTAKFVPGRVAGIQPPAMPDTETTFDELKARISATVDFLKSVPREAFDGKEAAPVTLKLGGQAVDFTAQTYIQTFALPNFYFHATTLYAILRHKGVPIGKVDFIAGGGR
ncbi:MAG: DUF1993 domain-containing protein [Rhizobiaceae bacterium]|nr:DUF1993 domain-containing protein [Rhizobiaceae bacterium]